MKTTNEKISKKLKKTNEEISKKLKEIGFEAETDIVENYELYPSYNLETLINALPDSITREYKSAKDGTIKEFEEKLIITKDRIYYKCYDLETSDDADKYLREYGYYPKLCEVAKSWDSESLADTAGKLLIELFEAGIINFKK